MKAIGVRGQQKYFLSLEIKSGDLDSKIILHFCINLLSIISLKIVFIFNHLSSTCWFSIKIKRNVLDTAALKTFQSSKVITPAIFIPHILLPEIISGSYLCLYTYIFSWPHSNRAICIIFFCVSTVYDFWVLTTFKIEILSGLYEVSIHLVDSYGYCCTNYWSKIQVNYTLCLCGVHQKILFIPDFEYWAWKLTAFRVAI